MTIATLAVEIHANHARLQQDVSQIQGSFDKIGSFASKVGGVLAGVFTVTAITGAISKYVEFTGKLSDMSAKTGISASGLQTLEMAFKNSGVSIDTVTTAIGKMSQNLVNGDRGAVGALANLGLKASELKNLAPDQAFIKISDAIAGIQNPMERSTAAMAIFGRGGTAVLAGMDGKLAETTDAYKRMGLVLSDDVVAAGDAFGDSLEVMKTQGMAMLGQMIAPMMPALTTIAKSLGDLASRAVPWLGNQFKELTVVGLSLQRGFWDLVATIVETAAKVPGLGKAMGVMGVNAEEMRAKSAALTTEIKTWTDVVPKAEAAIRKVAPVLGDYGTGAGKAAKATEEVDENIQRLTTSLESQIEKFRESNTLMNTVSATFRLPRVELELLGVSSDIATRGMARFKDVVKDTGSAVDSFGKKLHDGLRAELNKIPQTLANALTGGGGIEGGIKATVSGIGAAVGGTLGFAIGGPLGASIGSAIGSMAGLVVGPLKKLFGFGVDEAAKAAAEAAKKANEKLFADLTAQLGVFRTKLDGLIGKGAELGYTFDNAGNIVGVSFQKMRDVAGKYGTDLASLGPAFQGSRLHESAQTIIDDFWLLVHGGADVGGVLAGMTPQITALVNDSKKFGIDIPENMKPWIKSMIDAGVLVDADGQKIKDLTGISFGPPVEAQFLTIQSAIMALITKIDALISRIASIPTEKTLTVTTVHNDVFNTERRGGDNWDLPDWGGAQARGGDYMVTRPTLFLAGEAGPERATFSGANRQNERNDSDIGDRLDRLIQDLPRAMQIAFSDVMVLQGVRR